MIKIVSTGSTISSTEFREKKRRAKRRRASLVGGGVLLILILFTVLMHWNKLRVKVVEVHGALVTGEAPVISLTASHLQGAYFWLWPKDSILLYPKKAIVSDLMAKFPRFGSASVSLSGLSTLEVLVSEREPFALYCSEECLFVDDTGFIFDKAPTFSDGVYVVYHLPTTDLTLGHSVLERDSFINVNQFINDLKTLGLVVREASLVDNIVTFTLDSGASLSWRLNSSADEIFGNLSAFLKTQGPGFWQTVATVDLGTPNKVFYSFKTKSE